MALLSSSWLLVEFFIIPDGLIKWFYLSFYVHPFFLIFCQIFLWLRWPFYIIFFLPFKITCYVYSLTLIYSRRFVIIILSYARFRDTKVVDDVPDEFEHVPELIMPSDQNLIMDSYCTARNVAGFTESYEISVFKVSEICLVHEVGDEFVEEMENMIINEDSISEEEEEEEGFSSNDELMISRSSRYISSPIDAGMNLNFPSPSDCILNSPLREQELTAKREDEIEEEEIDPFHEEYKDRMRWFDLLNQDRAFALSTILSKQSTNDAISIERRDDKMAKKRMVKSLEHDIEMVYVAQLCLTWEALYYQHKKVESQMACSSSTSTPTSSDGTFHYYNSRIAAEFQKFKILLERFMEDERLIEGHRYWNYVQKRSSHESLLQVPDISAGVNDACSLQGSDMEEEKQGSGREAMPATVMLRAIDKCIKTFWLFLQTEKRKQWWKPNSLLWTRPPLEDPRDLKLLHDLATTLQKKEVWLKDLKGKKRCWLRRAVNPLEGNQKKEMLFAMIEMKLVSRVLSMSMISTRQLNWCQEKLSSIDFIEGKAIRSCNIGSLFPSS